MQQNGPGLIVKFYLKAIKNEFESTKAGRDIWEEREHVNIIIPGDKFSEIDTLAEEHHRERFPMEYARFKAGEATPVVGTPLAQWPPMSSALVKEWAYLNVQTVEQLAAIPDTAKQRFGMGADEWVRRAKAFLEASHGVAVTEQFARENDALKNELAEQKELIAAMAAKIQEMQQEPVRRGPGRPPKEQAA